jgi:DMSO/TMAO reductase YedYZ molybdopterin-dependent catalytic subunit
MGGVALIDLVESVISAETEWSQVEVISGDGFGNRIYAHELRTPTARGSILLCLTSNGRPLSRAHGLVRLIVPSEIDNALRQIKWVRHIHIR